MRSFILVSLVIAICSVACLTESTSNEPSPIQVLLQEDSLYRSTLGDSTNPHVTFDYENLNRVAWQKPSTILSRLGDTKAKTIIEVGSGTGFFTRLLAKQAKRVIALDIDPEMLLILDSLNSERLDSFLYQKIDPRLVPADDPKLGVEEGDGAMVVNTFMYIPKRKEYLEKLIQGLKPGSPVVIVDFKKKNTPVGPPESSRLPLFEVEESLRLAGFEQIISDDTTLDFQYIVKGIKP